MLAFIKILKKFDKASELRASKLMLKIVYQLCVLIKENISMWFSGH